MTFRKTLKNPADLFGHVKEDPIVEDNFESFKKDFNGSAGVKKLLSPTELKLFFLKQEEEKNFSDQKVEEIIIEETPRRIVSPSVLFNPPSTDEELEVEEVIEKTPIEILDDKIINIKETYFNEILNLKNSLSEKITIDNLNLESIESKLDNLAKLISDIPEIKYYDQDIASIRSDIDSIEIPVVPEVRYYDDQIKYISERIEQLQRFGYDSREQTAENAKKFEDIIDQIFNDIQVLNDRYIPEDFDPTELQNDISSVKDSLFEKVSEIKEEISNLPEVRYYEDELKQLSYMIEDVRSSIPVVPEIKYYDDDLKDLLGMIDGVRQNISELPEVRYYEDEISNLEEQLAFIEIKISQLPEVKYYDKDISNVEEKIEGVHQRITDLPEVKYYDDNIFDLEEQIGKIENRITELPEVKYYDSEINNISEDVKDINDKIVDIKLIIQNIRKTVDEVEGREIPEKFDPSSIQEDIEKIYYEIEKLKTTSLEEENQDPLVPLDQNFVTFDDLKEHYRLFINRVQQQLSSLGGGGETRLKYLDDIVGIATNASAYDGKFLKYDHSLRKFVFETVSGGGGSGNTSITISDTPPVNPQAGNLWYDSIIGRTFIYYVDQDSSQWVDASPSGSYNVENNSYWISTSVGIHTLSNVGVGTTNPKSKLEVFGDAKVTGVITSQGLNVGTGGTIITTNSGFVGVATTTPIAKLNIGGPYVDTLSWVVTYGDVGIALTTQAFSSVSFDKFGNIYASGSDYDNGIPFVIKFNNAGTILWQKFFSHPDPNRTYKVCESVSVDKTNDVIYVAVNSDDVVGSAILLKLNSSGDILWQNEIDDVSYDYSTSTAVSPNGDVYIVGGTYSQGSGSDDALIVKFNSSGTLQWQRVIGNQYSNTGYGVGVDSSNNVYVVGEINTAVFSDHNTFIVKFNSSGTLQWQKVVSGVSGEGGFGVAFDSGDNVYIVGDTNSQGYGDYDATIIKLNSSGVEQWQRIIGKSVSETGLSIVIDSEDLIYITGQISIDKLFVSSFDISGNELYQREVSINVGELHQLYLWGHDYIDIRNDELVIGGYVTDSGGDNNGFIIKTKNDFYTGYYGNSFVVSQSNLTVGIPTLTISTSSLTISTSTLPVSASGIVTATSFPSYSRTIDYFKPNNFNLVVDGLSFVDNLKTTELTVNGDARVGIDTSQGIVMTSPNGTKYRLIVDNSGNLSTVLVP